MQFAIKETAPFSDAEILIKHKAASFAITSDASLVSFNKAVNRLSEEEINDKPSVDPVKPLNKNIYISLKYR